MNFKAGQNIPEDRVHIATPWRQALPLLVLLMVWTLFLYRETGIAMVTVWARSETFNHAFLVPPIVLWLVWRRRDLIAAEIPQPVLGVFFLVAGAAFAWLLADLVAINAVTQLAFVGLLVLAVPALLGWRVTHLILFPLGFAFFSVPIGEFVMPQLMEWTANFTVFALRLSGIPVYREGLQFVIPSGTWSVVEACSGVRYLIASLTVGALFAYLNYQSTKRRILFVIVSILVPIVANWMRAYLIVMLGHFSGNKLAAGVDHLIYGWAFFGIVIMLMFVIGGRWAEPERVMWTNTTPQCAETSFISTRLWVAGICFAALVALPQMVSWSIDRLERDSSVSLVAPIALAAGWETVAPVAIFKPAFENPSAEINGSYARYGKTVGLYLGYYRHQDYAHKLVNSNNVLVVSNDAKWVRVTSSHRPVLLGTESVNVRTAELRGATLSARGNPIRLVVWQVYWINGMLTANDYVAKFYSAFYRLIGRGDSSAVIVLYMPQNDQEGGGEAGLEAFLSSNYASINKLLLEVQKASPK